MPCALIGMYWVKCKQTQRLTTYCSHFLLIYSNQAMTKSAHLWSWSCDLHGNLGGVFFSRKYSRRPHRYPQKLIALHIQLSGRNGDHEWLRMKMLLYYVSYYERFRKVMQRTEKVALTIRITSELSLKQAIVLCVELHSTWIWICINNQQKLGLEYKCWCGKCH